MTTYRGLLLFYWLKIILIMYIAFELYPPSWVGHVLMILSIAGPLMLVLGIPMIFKGANNRFVLLLLLFLVTFWMYAHLLYYRFYEDFLTLTILLQVGHVGGVSRSTWELISPWDVLIFLDIFVIGWWLFNKERFAFSRKQKTNYLISAFTITLMILIAALIHKPHLFKESYDRSQLVTSISLFSYQVYDIFHSISAPVKMATADVGDTEPMQEYMEKKDNSMTEWFGKAQGKNVVFISLESVQNFVIDLDIEGQEVTPFLNELKEESLYFSNVYEQTAQGKSSDAEFMIDTGLYPLDGGSVFVRRPENTYEAIPHILENYQSVVFHGNERSFWNRDEMYESLGYDRFYSERDFDVNEENSVNYGLKDDSFFKQSIPMMKDLQEPYLAKFITLTNHFPFLLDEEDQTFETTITSEPVVNRYLATVHYMDQTLKDFFQSLKDAGMYENTMFVLFGDHYGISTEYEDGVNELLNQPDTIQSHVKNQQVPVLIHIPGLGGKEVDRFAGQIDIRSTVLHLLGKTTSNYMSMSKNMLAESADPVVIFRDGDFVSESNMYIEGQCYETEDGKLLDIKNCKDGKAKARKELQLSDEVIKGDWLRFR